jgi:hypothetical protein
MYSSKNKLFKGKCYLHYFPMFTDSDPERETESKRAHSWKFGQSQQPSTVHHTKPEQVPRVFGIVHTRSIQHCDRVNYFI